MARLTAIIIGIGLLSFASPPPALACSPEITDFARDEHPRKLRTQGIITNRGKTPCGQIFLKLAYRTEDDKFLCIDQASVFATRVEPGGTTTFTTFGCRTNWKSGFTAQPEWLWTKAR
tara:strand:- start:473 stop:826 length:354 start_codon:yes stop_codon:yes gene_type:complete